MGIGHYLSLFHKVVFQSHFGEPMPMVESWYFGGCYHLTIPTLFNAFAQSE